jgi:hypothetical protein
MRKLVLIAAIALASTSVHAQSIDVGSMLQSNGISLGGAGGQQQTSGQSQMGQQQPSQRSARRGKHGKSRESAQETRARGIAAKYGISW